jgi:hypothetical protein
MLLAGVQGFKTPGFPPEACGNDVRMVESDICFLPDTLGVYLSPDPIDVHETGGLGYSPLR